MFELLLRSPRILSLVAFAVPFAIVSFNSSAFAQSNPEPLVIKPGVYSQGEMEIRVMPRVGAEEIEFRVTGNQNGKKQYLGLFLNVRTLQAKRSVFTANADGTATAGNLTAREWGPLKSTTVPGLEYSPTYDSVIAGMRVITLKSGGRYKSRAMTIHLIIDTLTQKISYMSASDRLATFTFGYLHSGPLKTEYTNFSCNDLLRTL